MPDRRLDSPVPDKNSGTRTGTARDRLGRSGPGPDPVQMVPGGTFILGRVDMVRGTWGGGWVVRLWGGMAQHQTCQSCLPPCSVQSVATDSPLRDSGGGGGCTLSFMSFLSRHWLTVKPSFYFPHQQRFLYSAKCCLSTDGPELAKDYGTGGWLSVVSGLRLGILHEVVELALHDLGELELKHLNAVGHG